MSLYSEIKKYLLYLVAFFCLLIGTHLVVLYLYHDAEIYPVNGGTLNIGIIGGSEKLDIATLDTKIEDSSAPDVAIRFLFRSLIRLSLEDQKIVGDLTRCNLDTFPNIRCTINQDAIWSDGAAITIDDILRSYQFYKDNTTNESTRTRLALVVVSEDKGDVIFRFDSRDITMIDILFLPIFRSQDLDVWSPDINLIWWSFSGPFVLAESDSVDHTLLLKRNTTYKSWWSTYLDQIRLGFGSSLKEIWKNIKPDMWIWDAWNESNTKQTTYSRPVFYGIFLNSERLPITLRNALFSDVFSTIPLTTDKAFVRQKDIFFGDVTPADISTESIFYPTVFSLGYSFWWVNAPTSSPPQTTQLAYISQPWTVTPLFISGEGIEIQWNAPDTTNKIIVNDYTLQNFAGWKTFSYKARSEFQNLIEGENTYKVSFFHDTTLLAEETITIFYSPDTIKLDTIKNDWVQKNTVPTNNIPSTKDPNKLYWPDWKQMHISLLVQDNILLWEEVANDIQEKLSKLWVDVSIEFKNLTSIREDVIAWSNYDMVIAGVNLGAFHYNVLPFLHSWQIKNGINIARIKNASLDTLLEKLISRLYYTAPDTLRNIESEVQKLLDNESIVYPLWTPLDSVSTKDYVKWVSIPKFFSGKEMLRDIVSGIYFKEWYKRSTYTKNISWFFQWIYHELFSAS